MRMLRGLFLAAGLAVLGGYGSAADAGTEPKTLMTERGKLLFSDDFSQAPGKEWKSAKGKWEVVDGALRGAELKSDNHGAATRRALPVKDFVIQYSFKLDGTRQTTLSINDAKGHNCRVAINPAGFTVQKDSHDKNVNDKAAVLERR